MRAFLHSFKKISDAGLVAVRIVLVMCCVMVGAAFVLCLFAGEPSAESFHTYRLARAMAETPAGVLLVAGIALMIVEDPAAKR